LGEAAETASPAQNIMRDRQAGIAPVGRGASSDGDVKL